MTCVQQSVFICLYEYGKEAKTVRIMITSIVSETAFFEIIYLCRFIAHPF